MTPTEVLKVEVDLELCMLGLFAPLDLISVIPLDVLLGV